jgi:hypothetical protein
MMRFLFSWITLYFGDFSREELRSVLALVAESKPSLLLDCKLSILRGHAAELIYTMDSGFSGSLSEIPASSSESGSSLQSGSSDSVHSMRHHSTVPSLSITLAPGPSSPRPSTSDVPMDLLLLRPESIAAQITFQESRLFRSMHPRELLFQMWNKDGVADDMTSNLRRIIERFNYIGFWVASEILMCSGLFNQAKTIRHFIRIAVHCRKLGNYNAVMELLSGLNNSCVRRLKLAWNMVQQNDLDDFAEFDRLMAPQSNFANYHAELNLRQPPVIPYLGLFMRDIIFIKDGTPLLLPETQTFNVELFLLLHERISSIKRFQAVGHDLSNNADVARLIAEARVETDEDVLYRLSLEAQPTHIQPTVSMELSVSASRPDLNTAQRLSDSSVSQQSEDFNSATDELSENTNSQSTKSKKNKHRHRRVGTSSSSTELTGSLESVPKPTAVQLTWCCSFPALLQVMRRADLLIERLFSQLSLNTRSGCLKLGDIRGVVVPLGAFAQGSLDTLNHASGGDVRRGSRSLLALVGTMTGRTAQRALCSHFVQTNGLDRKELNLQMHLAMAFCSLSYMGFGFFVFDDLSVVREGELLLRVNICRTPHAGEEASATGFQDDKFHEYFVCSYVAGWLFEALRLEVRCFRMSKRDTPIVLHDGLPNNLSAVCAIAVTLPTQMEKAMQLLSDGLTMQSNWKRGVIGPQGWLSSKSSPLSRGSHELRDSSGPEVSADEPLNTVLFALADGGRMDYSLLDAASCERLAAQHEQFSRMRKQFSSFSLNPQSGIVFGSHHFAMLLPEFLSLSVLSNWISNGDARFWGMPRERLLHPLLEFGHLAGQASDAAIAREYGRAEDPVDDLGRFVLASQLFGWGKASVHCEHAIVRIPTELLMICGVRGCVEGQSHDSHGVSTATTPQCMMYASFVEGYVSASLAAHGVPLRVHCIEVSCVAEGKPCCTFVIVRRGAAYSTVHEFLISGGETEERVRELLQVRFQSLPDELPQPAPPGDPSPPGE